MSIESNIFKRTKLNIDTLIPYGFIKTKNGYEYSKVFMNNFSANIIINEQGIISGKVYDINVDNEYTNF